MAQHCRRLNKCPESPTVRAHTCTTKAPIVPCFLRGWHDQVFNSAHQVPQLGTPGKVALPLTIPIEYLSYLQRILLVARWELRSKDGACDLCAAIAAPTTRALGGQRPLLRVCNRMTGVCITSSEDSNLEEFSHNPKNGSFTPLAFQPSVTTSCTNQ
ncbi:hypothetical protein GOBAR_DD05381 [Gossypium barbadense]|nr:hypothetical protein GOBAR_DD05381 [Gossypium barbadense]